jgi:hypothetical protein
VYSSTNKAVLADFFGDKAPAAFGNLIWSSGGASTAGYFIFPKLAGSSDCVGSRPIALADGVPQCKVDVQATLCVVVTVVGIITFIVALGFQRAEKRRQYSAFPVDPPHLVSTVSTTHLGTASAGASCA